MEDAKTARVARREANANPVRPKQGANEKIKFDMMAEEMKAAG